MFGKKKQNEKKESLNFKSDNYKLNDDNYVTNNLVVANLEYISSEPTIYGPMIKQTEQNIYLNY